MSQLSVKRRVRQFDTQIDLIINSSRYRLIDVIQKGYFDAVPSIIASNDIERVLSKTEDGRNCLILSTLIKNNKDCQFVLLSLMSSNLLERMILSDNFGLTVLHYAIITDNYIVVKLLSEMNINHLTVHNNHLVTQKKMHKKKQVLLTAKDNYGNTPLHYCVALDRQRLFKYLIDFHKQYEKIYHFLDVANFDGNSVRTLIKQTNFTQFFPEFQKDEELQSRQKTSKNNYRLIDFPLNLKSLRVIRRKRKSTGIVTRFDKKAWRNDICKLPSSIDNTSFSDYQFYELNRLSGIQSICSSYSNKYYEIEQLNEIDANSTSDGNHPSSSNNNTSRTEQANERRNARRNSKAKQNEKNNQLPSINRSDNFFIDHQKIDKNFAITITNRLECCSAVYSALKSGIIKVPEDDNITSLIYGQALQATQYHHGNVSHSHSENSKRSSLTGNKGRTNRRTSILLSNG
ncbi:hypothetical protein SNEBB_000909 [Seison nebaliae]|nr:hypothetical protein SNEBB_000909 [Seison nebaliae]